MTSVSPSQRPRDHPMKKVLSTGVSSGQFMRTRRVVPLNSCVISTVSGVWTI